jgi:hypothetical protein
MKETIRTVKNGSLTLNCVCWGADDAPAVLLCMVCELTRTGLTNLQQRRTTDID